MTITELRNAQGMCSVLICILVQIYGVSSVGIRTLEDLPNIFYTMQADVNIGVVIPVHRYNSQTFCSSAIREMGALQRVEAVAFAVREVNSREDILPNVTLGFTMMDDCSKDTTALVRALHLIQNNGASNISINTQLQPINVIGVIGSESSKNSVQIADLLSLFKIPVLSYLSTSPLLSNKFVYPYFSRIVPSDTLQAKVIVDILKTFGWTYVSIVYAEGSYGSEGYKAVKAQVEEIRYCLAVIREMRQSFTDNDYDGIMRELEDTPRAKVVIIFAPLAQTRALLTSAKRNRVYGQFTWIGSDAWGRNIQDYKDLEDVSLGALTVKFFSETSKRFDEYFKYLTPSNSSNNPWFQETVESETGCSFNGQSRKPPCFLNFSFGETGSYKPESTVSLVIDAVYTFASALHYLLSHCPETDMNDCFISEDFLRIIRNTSFHGENGLVSFDENGDGKATYEVQNLREINGVYSLSSIGLWDSYRETFTSFDMGKVTWKPSVLLEGESVPTSTCSDDCPKGFEAVRTQPHCCWYCKECRNNERTVMQDGLPQCEICPSKTNYTWPDFEMRTQCYPIEHTYTGMHDFTGIVIVTVDIFTVFVTILVTVFYIKNNEEKLIKASSRELSYLMLGGIFLSCVFVAMLATRPNDTTCNITYVGFHLSFTLTYAPLTVKTNRIYRIFTAGKKSTKRPLFIDSKSQIIFTVTILILQVSMVHYEHYYTLCPHLLLPRIVTTTPAKLTMPNYKMRKYFSYFTNQ